MIMIIHELCLNHPPPAPLPPQERAEALGGLLLCGALKELEVPIEIFDRCTPASPPLRNLAGLEITDLQNHLLTASGLWGFLSRGGTPRLTKLYLNCERCSWPARGEDNLKGETVVPQGQVDGSQLVTALEAVSGTLQCLSLRFFTNEKCPPDMFRSLGAAIGKLRRLKALGLNLSTDGRNVRAVAEGMATGACPELWSVGVSRVPTHS
jgi:hypothetical protein